MSRGDFLEIQPSELKFRFELRKKSSCCMQLTNKTDQYVAFKVKTTNPKNYHVASRNRGIVLPGSTHVVIVTMQAQKKIPSDMQCKDMFLIQSVIAPDGAKTEDMTPEMFNKEPDRVMQEIILHIVYIPANPTSPVSDESEEKSPLIAKLTKKKTSAIQLGKSASAFLTLIKKNATANHPHSD